MVNQSIGHHQWYKKYREYAAANFKNQSHSIKGLPFTTSCSFGLRKGLQLLGLLPTQVKQVLDNKEFSEEDLQLFLGF